MKTITINGWIQCKPVDEYTGKNNTDGFTYSFWEYEDMNSSGYVMVCPYELTFNLPETFSATAGLLMILDEKKQELRKEFAARVAQIDAHISKLTALEYTV